MASLTEIREALADRLKSITDLNVQPVVLGQIAVPAALIAPDSGPFLTYPDLDGSVDVKLIVTVLVATVVSDAAQNELDGYLVSNGPNSIKAAVDADPTLGSVAHYAMVTEARNYGLINYSGADYLGCEFLVDVRAL